MRWDRLFDDLESQLASEWDAERAALAAESERLRISRLELRTRLRALCAVQASATIELPGSRRERARLVALGSDWVGAALTPVDGATASRSTLLVPVMALRGIDLDHGLLLSSLDDERSPDLRERMSLGFVLRDLARRRTAVRVRTLDGTDLHGTIDRAGADHLDLALHDQGAARMASSVRGFRLVPLDAIASVQTAGDQLR